MTRETKIGLLVGLLFIIMVGMIIADHLSSSLEQPAPLAQAGPTAMTGVTTPGGTNALVQPPTAPPNVTPNGQILTRRDLEAPKDPPPGPGVAIVRVNGPKPGDPIVIGKSADQANQTSVQQIDPFADANHVIPAPDLIRQRDARIANAGAVAPPVPTPAAQPRLYAAVAGDTPSKIAQKLMGGNTHAHVQAFFDANKELKGDARKLVIGHKYIIPTVTAASTAAPATPGVADLPLPPAASPVAPIIVPPTAPPAGAGPDTANTRLYTVKAGDNLWKIAVAQCGGAGAIKAIRELNHDLKIDAPLKVGAKIRLPAKPSA